MSLARLLHLVRQDLIDERREVIRNVHAKQHVGVVIRSADKNVGTLHDLAHRLCIATELAF